MGFFDRFKKQPPAGRETQPSIPAPPSPPSGQPLIDIAAIISHGDPWVMEWIRVCADDIYSYVESNFHLYALRGLELEDDLDVLKWIGLVEILIEAQYVCERDWKDELPDFLHFIQNLKGTKRLKLPLDKQWLDPSKDVSDWIQRINSQWSAKSCCLSVIDIDSDSYVLFPCTLQERAQLQALARQLERQIQ